RHSSAAPPRPLPFPTRRSSDLVLDSTLPWSRLTLAIAYATEAHLFISDMNQSPFNIGTLLALEDFTLPQVAELNRSYGSPLQSEDRKSTRLNSSHQIISYAVFC